MRKPSISLVACIALAVLLSCGQRRKTTPNAAGAGPTKVLATVNRVAITDADLRQRSKGLAGGGPDLSANVLRTIVRDELIYQKAVHLGLDRDEEYQVRLNELEAQLRAFQRQEMSAAYRRYVQRQTAVTDAEARAYFDKNAPFIQTQFHVLQIFHKGRYPEIVKDSEKLKSGASFEEVASSRFAGMPLDGRRPWDLGELYWFQVPQSWRGVVDRLEPGQVSDVIQGENDRFWIIKLAGKRADPGVTFESEKERIVELLRKQKADALYDGMLAEMTRSAEIAYSK